VVTWKAFKNSLDQVDFKERGVSPVEDQPVPIGFGVSPDADQPGTEVVETTSVVGLEDITFGVSPVEDQPLIAVVLGFPVVDEGIGFGVSSLSHGVVVFVLAVVVFGFPVVGEGISFGVSPSFFGVVVFELAVVVFGFPVVGEGIGFVDSPWLLGVLVFLSPTVLFGFSGVEEGIGFDVSPPPVVVEASPVEGVGFGVWFGPTEVFEGRGRGVSSMVNPVDVVGGFAFIV